MYLEYMWKDEILLWLVSGIAADYAFVVGGRAKGLRMLRLAQHDKKDVGVNKGED